MTVDSYKFKLGIVRQTLDENDADAIIFISCYNRFWITGVNTEFGLVVCTKNEVYLLIDARDYECCKNNLTYIKCILFNSYKDLFELINKLNIKKLGFEEDYISYTNYNNVLKQANVNFLIPIKTCALRASKCTEEIQVIKKSMEIASNAINWIKANIKVGMSELEVKQMLTIYMLQQGASATSFDLIIAFGEHTANPHHQSTNRKLKENEFITCDIGCIYQGYCSDITRTFWLGKPSKKMLEIYNLVLKANLEGIKQAKVGINGNDLDKICRDIISTNHLYKDFFTHGTGHGVGIEIHEDPRVNKSYKCPILNNSVVTIEPGIYLPGFGGVRIEDSILVTNNGVEVLTKNAPK